MRMAKSLKSYKNTVHLYLDGIWKSGMYPSRARTAMYSWLATQMGIPKAEAHISLFNIEQCKQAIKILRPKYIQLMGKDIPYKRRFEMYSNSFVVRTQVLDASRHFECPNQVTFWAITVSCKASKLVNDSIIDKELFLTTLREIIQDYNQRLDTDNPMSIYNVAKLLYDKFTPVYKIEIDTGDKEVYCYSQEIYTVN